MIVVVKGEGRYQIKLTMHTTEGNGVCGFLFGGEKAHVGGVALASPYTKLSGEGLTSNLWIITVPNHKDINIAEKVAHQICVAINEAVSITAGVHINNATSDELTTLVDNCTAAAEAFIERYLLYRPN